MKKCTRVLVRALLVSSFMPFTCGGETYTITQLNNSYTHKVTAYKKDGFYHYDENIYSVQVPAGMSATVFATSNSPENFHCTGGSLAVEPNILYNQTTLYHNNNKTFSFVAFAGEPDRYPFNNLWYTYDYYWSSITYTITARYDYLKSDKPDLTASVSATPDTVRPGEPVTISYTISNRGNAKAESSTAAIYVDGERVASQSVPSLSAGSSKSDTYTLASGFATQGEHTIMVKADVNDNVNEETGNNNSATCTVKVPYSDLTATVYASPSVTTAGAPITVSFTIYNRGDGDAGSSTATIYVNGSFEASQSVPSLSAGASKTYTYTFQHGFAAAGNYAIKVEADSSNAVHEDSEENNSDYCTVKIPYLTIPSSVPDASAQACTVSADVRSNVGYSAQPDVDWLEVQPNDSLLMEFSRNISLSPRTAHVRIWNEWGHEGSITVTQEGMTLADAVAASASDAVSSAYVDVAWANSDRAITYVVQRSESEDGPWLTLAEVTSTSYRDESAVPGVGYLYRILANNELGAAVGIADEGRRRLLFGMTSQDRSVDDLAHDGTIAITGNHDWTVASDAGWVAFDITSGHGGATVAYSIAKNYTADERIATVTVTSGAETKSFTITQAGQKIVDISTGSVAIDTGTARPTLTLGDGTVHYGTVSNGIAVFWFDYFSLGKDVAVSITGSRPLIIESDSDMVVAADIDVSGSVAGRCGGGIGGKGGKGGEAVSGGAGGEGGYGGDAMEWELDEDEKWGVYEWKLFSAPIGGYNWGGDGLPSMGGANGVYGTSGWSASLAFGQTTPYAKQGECGTGGLGGSAVEGGIGGGKPMEYYSSAMYYGTDGDTGKQGTSGTSGAGACFSESFNGENGVNDMSGVLNGLDLVAGAAGGGGGGGGSGGGGAGGGGAGGGASGRAYGLEYGQMRGGDGGAGGMGGTGATGGIGGAGGDGGDGGDGGGAVFFKARGTLAFSGRMDVSAYNVSVPAGKGQLGGASVSGEVGQLGKPGTSVVWTDGKVHYGGTGGNGGRGGTGGRGGNGADGGRGGYGAPGMVKLCGSLIVANGGTVVADNGNGDTADNRCGAVTFISNMTVAERTANEPFCAAKLLKGSCRLDGALMAASVYSPSVKVPIIGQLKTVRSGVAGICAAGGHALAKALRVAAELEGEGLRLRRVGGIYEGFDQMFVENVSGAQKRDGAVVIAGNVVALGVLGVGEFWTTCVPTGTAVSLSTVVEEVEVVLEALSVSGEVSLPFNGTATYACRATMSDGTTKTVAPVWSVLAGGAYATISESGTLTANNQTVASHNVTILASYTEGDVTKTAQLTVVVKELGPEFTVRDGCLTKVVLNDATDVVIPNGVTSIGSSAFRNCHEMISVTIPSGVMSIGNCAFEGCTSLRNVELPPGLKSIGYGAFYECSSLEAIVIPESVTNIGYAAFCYCESLESANVPPQVRVIEASLFDGCLSLTSVAIPEGVVEIQADAFLYCTSLTNVNLPSSLK